MRKRKRIRDTAGSSPPFARRLRSMLSVSSVLTTNEIVLSLAHFSHAETNKKQTQQTGPRHRLPPLALVQSGSSAPTLHHLLEPQCLRRGLTMDLCNASRSVWPLGVLPMESPCFPAFARPLHLHSRSHLSSSPALKIVLSILNSDRSPSSLVLSLNLVFRGF